MSKEDATDLKSKEFCFLLLSQWEEGGAIFSDFVSTHPFFLLTSSRILAATLGYPCYFNKELLPLFSCLTKLRKNRTVKLKYSQVERSLM